MGYSDHGLGSDHLLTAIGFGAKVIEKHFVVDKSDESPDSFFSLDFEQFKKFNFKKHINLQLGAGIDKQFETLLNNSKINPNNRYKSVSGICQYWGKAV